MKASGPPDASSEKKEKEMNPSLPQPHAETPAWDAQKQSSFLRWFAEKERKEQETPSPN